LGQLRTSTKKLKDTVYADDTKMHIMNYELDILKRKFERLHDEAEYRSGGKKFP